MSIAPKEECIIIEDSTNGVKQPRQPEFFVLVTTSQHSMQQDLTEADVVINHFNELNAQKYHSSRADYIKFNICSVIEFVNLNKTNKLL